MTTQTDRENPAPPPPKNQPSIQPEIKTEARTEFKSYRSFLPAWVRAIWPAVLWIAFLLLLPLVYTPNPTDTDLTRLTLGPGTGGILGTDELGRDVLARVLEGARISLGAGFAGGFAALLLGATLGVVAAFWGGFFDWLVLRLLEAFLAMPATLVALLLTGAFGAGATTLIVAAALLGWMPVARVTREETRRLLVSGWVGAASAIGVRPHQIVWRHIVPHILPLAAVLAVIEFRQAVILEATLSYLGAGIQPPAPSWGNMLSGAQLFLLSAPHLALAPGLCITLTLLFLEGASRRLTQLRPRL